MNGLRWRPAPAGLGWMALAAVCAGWAAEPFPVPEWREGDCWFVESRRVVLSLHGSTPRPSEQASPATTWEYRVASVRTKGALKYYQVLARDSAGRDPRRAGFIFLSRLDPAGRPHGLALASATFESPVKGRLQRLSRDYRKDGAAPSPVVGEDSLIPADFPLFDATSTPATTAVTFEVTEMLGGLPFARDVMQAVRAPAAGARYPREEALLFQGPREPIAPKVATDPDRDVEWVLSRPADGALVHQIWSPGRPWAIYSRSQLGISYLVEPPALPQQPSGVPRRSHGKP
ncbi:MAG: hypothetical protein HYY25_09365 [Candidatus Wallbacteria bacterium]|nr:hypothetical protein [Candidatus Wallbacteria bacterium]